MRLNRYLASCGLGSRRGCEALIVEGRVTIGKKICTDLSRQVEEGESVKVDGKPARPAPAQTIALFKPRGLVTTRNDELERPTVYEILPDHLHDLSHIGRLDQESEGLLLMTRDGDLGYALTHPSGEIEKEYLVTLDQAFDRQHTDRLLRGIRLEEGTAKAKSFQILSPRRVQIVLTQGMKRQIRRMLEALGYRVRKLVRVRIGQLSIGNLTDGRWRPLSDNELVSLTSNPESVTTSKESKTEAISKNPTKEKQSERESAKRRAKAKRMAADRQWKRNQSSSKPRRKSDGSSKGRGRGRGQSRGRGRGGGSSRGSRGQR